MNEKQEEFILYCLSFALSRGYPRQREEIQGFITTRFRELGDEE